MDISCHCCDLFVFLHSLHRKYISVGRDLLDAPWGLLVDVVRRERRRVVRVLHRAGAAMASFVAEYGDSDSIRGALPGEFCVDRSVSCYADAIRRDVEGRAAQARETDRSGFWLYLVCARTGR